MRTALEGPCRLALPVVVRRNAPLEFWSWHSGMALQSGIWDIPIPAHRQVAQPSILLSPLVGFDREGYRLGYGGGYYDRTVASMSAQPFLVGIGHDAGRLDTIYPQSHDIPMDVIVTESGLMWAGHTGRSHEYMKGWTDAEEQD